MLCEVRLHHYKCKDKNAEYSSILLFYTESMHPKDALTVSGANVLHIRNEIPLES